MVDDRGVIEFGTRMLHSALVDADFLDTAAHFTPDLPASQPSPDFDELFERFESARRDMLAGRPAAPIDRWRADVYDACLAAAGGGRGVYRLPAPTGSGKTLAAAGFALRHAAVHGMRRVVVAVPFISITEQNAAVYRSLLGSAIVLEHHSWVEPDRDGLESRSRYGMENWDSPFVVTTTVQLFESLFSNKPGRARKLHRLAGAVVVLDEIQAVPVRVLPAVLDGLRLLVTYFGTTVLLASATQPVWEMVGPWRDSALQVGEILRDPSHMYAAMSRVRYSWLEGVNLAEVADAAAAWRQCLVVLNTTADARRFAVDLRERFPNVAVRHLSTRMCPAHRRRVLEEVRARLKNGDPVTLVSTQVVEAGVDVDFPTVYRAVAPAESLVQAAGRANREGHMRRGEVVIFDAADAGAPRGYRTGTALAIQHFRHDPDRLNDPAAMTGYYRSLYSAVNPEGQRFARELAAARRDLQFETVANLFRMIEDDTQDVAVPFDDAASRALDAIGDRAADGRVPTTADFRILQPFMVSLPRRALSRPEVAANLVELPGTPGITVWRGGYDRLTGVDLTGGPADSIF